MSSHRVAKLVFAVAFSLSSPVGSSPTRSRYPVTERDQISRVHRGMTVCGTFLAAKR